MAFSRGELLGRYEILGPLGAGGMGEVYRSRDRELEREVAIKVLPSAVAGDPERMARFQREARAVAALSHPNILEIFDVGTHDSLQYAVTELLEGQTLRERLPAGGIPWQKVVEIGSDIAKGLAAAHGKGIVHRDVKPENVFITSDGRVKVLDFGLARVQPEDPDKTETASITPAGTVPGTIMGTPAYMAPEQVRGKPADHRSDIFALGCLLYEMVVGRQAFGGDTLQDTMAAILKEEPPRPSATGAALPIDLERTIHRCLEKSPEARYQSAADLAYHLRMTAAGAAVAMATPTGEVRPMTRRWWPAAAVAALLIAGASVVGWLTLRTGDDAIVEAPAAVQIDPSPFVDEWRVAVEPFDNRSGDPALDPLGRTLTDRVMEGLARVGQGLAGLTPVSAEAAGAGSAEGSPQASAPGNIGRLLVTGFYSDPGTALDVTIQVREPHTRGVLYSTGAVEVPRRAADDQLAPLLDMVMGAVATHVRVGLKNVSHVPDYALLREWLGRQKSRGAAANREALTRLLELDPEYLEPVMSRAAAAVHAKRFEEADLLIDHIRRRRHRLTEYESFGLAALDGFRKGDPARALKATRELQRLAPRDGAVRYSRARFARDLGAHEEVVETLAGFIDHIPETHESSRGTLSSYLIESYEALGRFEESLVIARRLRHELPIRTYAYCYEASALVALGRIDEVAETVAACEGVPGGECDVIEVVFLASWRLAAHGHRDKARDYALRAVELQRSRTEIEDGSYSEAYLRCLRAAELWEEYEQHARLGLEQLKEGSFEHNYALCAVGMAAAHFGDRAAAESVISRLLSDEDFSHAGKIVAHLGELDRAVELLRRSVTSDSPRGYGQFRRWDLDLEPVWSYPPFREMAGLDE